MCSIITNIESHGNILSEFAIFEIVLIMDIAPLLFFSCKALNVS
jgi:hypothetical protein